LPLPESTPYYGVSWSINVNSNTGGITCIREDAIRLHRCAEKDTMQALDNTVLIIAGKPKAGTTSLFRWLGQHPEICPAGFKETRFFLDRDYPLVRNIASDKIEDYLNCFPDRTKPVLLEASPDYLFCERFLSVPESLPNHKIVLIERDPVERMQSAWRYFRQRGLIEGKMTFDAFIEAQDNNVVENTPLEWRALDQCRPIYTERAKEVFGDRLLVLDFAEMSEYPAKTCRKVLSFCGLPTHPVDTFSFSVENSSRKVKNALASKAFFAIRGVAARAVGPRMKNMLRPLSKFSQKILQGDLEAKQDVTLVTREAIMGVALKQ